MGAIADGNVPVIYKGAMITKLILQENDFDDFLRETQDIDASWAGANPPEHTLFIVLNSCTIMVLSTAFGLAVFRRYEL